jgi:dimethyladenosine transferase 1
LKVDYDNILLQIEKSPLNDYPIHIIGNLPFNIASPLLLQWLHQTASREGLFGTSKDVWLTLMFQKEVGDVS